MQLTIDIDQHFLDELKQEFKTPDIKEALYRLLEFYKNSSHLELESIEKHERDYQLILDARKRRSDGEKRYSIDEVLKEFE